MRNRQFFFEISIRFNNNQNDRDSLHETYDSMTNEIYRIKGIKTRDEHNTNKTSTIHLIHLQLRQHDDQNKKNIKQNIENFNQRIKIFFLKSHHQQIIYFQSN